MSTQLASRTALLYQLERVALDAIWANANDLLPQAVHDAVRAAGEVDWFRQGEDGSAVRFRAAYDLWASWVRTDEALDAAHRAVAARPRTTRREGLERLLAAKIAYRRGDLNYAHAAAGEAAGLVASLRGWDDVARSEAYAAGRAGFALEVSNTIERLMGTWVAAQGASGTWRQGVSR